MRIASSLLVLSLLAGCTGELIREGPDDPPMLMIDAGPDGGDGTRDAGPGGGTDAGPGGGTDAGPGGSDAGPVMPGECAGGPLDAPIPGCRPAPPPSTGDPAQDCVNRINQLRMECQCLPPLARWTEGEACADMHAEYDGMGAGAHGGFRDRICSPGGRAQNECPGYPSMSSIVSTCLQQMWDEGPGEPFSEHGHYINMTNPAHGRVACGFWTDPSTGRVWAVQNFSN